MDVWVIWFFAGKHSIDLRINQPYQSGAALCFAVDGNHADSKVEQQYQRE